MVDSELLGNDVDEAFGVKKTIDDVASRHLAERGLSPAIPHGHGEVPPDEDDPSVRDGTTMSQVDASPDLSDEQIRSLEDLMARFPFDGTGIHYIRVVRKRPRTWQGYQCDGVQRPITVNLTQQEFIEQYGGGEYSLIVYGPPRRGGLIDPVTGLLKPKALTKEVTFTVSHDSAGVFGHPPNPESAIQEEPVGDPMEPTQSHMPFLRRPATPADASMHKASLDDVRIREDRTQGVEAARARAEADVEKTRILRDSALQERTLDLLEQRTNSTAADPALMVRALAEVFKSQAPKDNSDQVATMLENARLEIQRMAATHKEELLRITDQGERERVRLREGHQQDVERLNKTHDLSLETLRREIGIERENGARNVKDLDDSRHREIESLKADNARVLASQERDAERRVADAERALRAQIDAEKTAHERELRSLQTISDSKQHTDKSLLDERLRIAKEENVRLQGEVTRLTEEVRVKGDLPGQIEKFTAVADALGFAKADGSDQGEGGPKDWKEQVMEVAKEIVPKLPDLLRATGEVLQSRRAAPQQPQQQMVGPGVPMVAPPPGPMPQRLSFATEDTDVAIQHTRGIAPTPVTASMYPPNMPVQQQMVQPEMQQVQPVQQQLQSAPQMMQPASAPQQQIQPVTEQPTQAPPTPPGITDAEVLSFRPAFEAGFGSKQKPADFVKDLLTQFPAEAVKNIATALRPEIIFRALHNSPEAKDSVLLSFKGKRWIREVMKLASEVQVP
jgi:hypothetical protein